LAAKTVGGGEVKEGWEEDRDMGVLNIDKKT
jgi:hypothetical protein